jgi:hypothetical protein
MPVKHSSAPSQRRDGHQAKDPVVKPGGLISVGHKSVLPKIEAVIVNRALFCSPPELVSAKTFVGNGSPAKIELGGSFLLQLADRLPHHEIVGAQTQIVFIRSAKLVICLRTLMQKDSTGDGFRFGSRNRDKS